MRQPLPQELMDLVRRSLRVGTAQVLAHQIHASLEQVEGRLKRLMSRKDAPAFHRAAERALALNPLDGGAMAGIAMFTAFLGEWQRGCELMQRAMTLNPRHPGWYWFPFIADAYRRKEYSQALDYALRLNLPGFFHTHIWFAAVYGQLGNRDEAARALRDLDALYPDFGSHARRELDKWLAEGALVEHWLEGLRKAGLEGIEARSAEAR